jgi:hypothetical protein
MSSNESEQGVEFSYRYIRFIVLRQILFKSNLSYPCFLIQTAHILLMVCMRECFSCITLDEKRAFKYK